MLSYEAESLKPDTTLFMGLNLEPVCFVVEAGISTCVLALCSEGTLCMR